MPVWGFSCPHVSKTYANLPNVIPECFNRESTTCISSRPKCLKIRNLSPKGLLVSAAWFCAVLAQALFYEVFETG